MLGFLPINLLPTAGPRFREISSLLQWVYCFNLYIGAWDMMTYSRLLMCKATRHGGSGWLQYDRTFHRQQSIDPSLRWKILQPTLQPQPLWGIALVPDFSVRSVGNVTTQQKLCPVSFAAAGYSTSGYQGQFHPPMHIPGHRQDQRQPDTSVSLGIVDHAPIQGSASTVTYVLIANFVIWLKITQTHQRTWSISGQGRLALHSLTALPRPALVLVQ